MSLTLDEQKRQQLEVASQHLKVNLKKLGINIGYKILDDGLIMSIDLESLINAIFRKYPNVYRNYQIYQDKYLILEVK
ncbi:MAG: hypothetical protein RXO36_04545 [Candidatus Nanopusillus acidilobi]